MKLIALTLIALTLASCGKSNPNTEASKFSSNTTEAAYCHQGFIDDGMDFVDMCAQRESYNSCEKVEECLASVSELIDRMPTETCESVSQEDLDKMEGQLIRIQFSIQYFRIRNCSETAN